MFAGSLARVSLTQQRGTMCVTRSAFTQLMVPVSTSAAWNSVGTLGFLAPPSTQITPAMRQSLPSSRSRGADCVLQANAIRCALTLIWPFDFAFSLIRFKERNLLRQPHQSILCGQSLIVVGVSHEGSGGTKWTGEANAIWCALTLMSELDFAFSLVRLHERNPWSNPLKFLVFALHLEAL